MNGLICGVTGAGRQFCMNLINDKMNKIKQRISELRTEISEIIVQRSSLDAMQQLELFGLKERLRELESLVSDENEYPIEGYLPPNPETLNCSNCNKHTQLLYYSGKLVCKDCK